MKKKISVLAILASLSASLAFAGDNTKPASSKDAQPAANAAAASTEQNPCVTNDKSKKAKKSKANQKPEPTDQEKEFDRVLMGIFG